MKKRLAMLCLCLGAASAHGERRIEIGLFSQARLDGWEIERFEGETRYRLESLGDTKVLSAQSRSAASGLFRKVHVDLSKTPYLHWRWRIEKRLGLMDEKQKSGDDYVARIYVVVSGGWQFWKTRAINYVWSGNQAVGSVWPNAFAGDHAMMMALRGRGDATGVWYEESRNVAADLEQLFGEKIRYIDAVALMTDTDNAGGEAVSYYGDIYFSER